MRVQRTSPDKRTMDGIVFDSITEMKRYADLKLLQRAGEIRELQYQPKFDIKVREFHICYYSPDFTYIYEHSNAVVVEDVKGWKVSKKTGKMLPRVNREFGIKVKLMQAVFGLKVEVV